MVTEFESNVLTPRLGHEGDWLCTHIKSPDDQISNALDIDVQSDGRCVVSNLVVHWTSKIEMQRRTWIYKMKME